MPLRAPDEEEQSHSVTQKQAPRRYPTQGPKHDARLPWVISSHPHGFAGCHGPLRLLHPSHKPGPEYFQAIQDPFLHSSRHSHGCQGAPAAMPRPAPFTQPCSSVAASHLAATKVLSRLSTPVSHPSPSFPPCQPWYRPSLCPSPAPRCEGKPVLARQGKELFS